LVDPPGYKTAVLGTLGGVKESGQGTQAMILIPGLGFGGDEFDELMARWGTKFRMYTVTLPGFGGTAAPPSPAESVSFGDQTWTNGALRAIENLIEKEHIKRPIIVGHWLTGTQLALRLAINHPGDVRAVIIMAGSARFVATDTARMPRDMPLDRRVAGIDKYIAPRWFKTVTRATWDDNNFLPADYAINPVRGLRLWREAAEPPLHVWVRYLCEFHAQDIVLELDRLTVPTLVVNPGLEGIYHDPGSNYMQAFTHSSWDGATDRNPKIKFVTLPDSRACLWFDQPEKLDAIVEDFLKGAE
jgi:pimeloyl-ACP methyl ester carboxylesterase